MPGKCKFQDSWLTKDAFKDWLVKDAGDIHFARCLACCKSIKLQTMGEAALTSHAGGAGHKAAVRKLLEGKSLSDTGQTKGSVNQAENSKDQIAICLQRDALERITGSNWSDLHPSTTANSTSHNAALKDAAFPTTFFTAPGTSRLINQRLHLSDCEKEDAGHRLALHDTLDLSRLEQQQRADALEEQQQMKILEWENRMKVLAWEQELLREKMKAARQKQKAFRMKKIYYRAKLKSLGEDVSPSSSSSGDEEEKIDLTV
ncbi:uncharacterized protein LOC108233077 [Kryptolebias marmoratus]|uniref:uncharacterized protein LOC108233077 n=1 Tax=Kryptolebias marmoratus TaxID=37003 RepID=UPI0007F87473|nr:uncharacterized protein LOC108233077 [Kryptolebias marmoratus]